MYVCTVHTGNTSPDGGRIPMAFLWHKERILGQRAVSLFRSVVLGPLPPPDLATSYANNHHSLPELSSLHQ